MASAGFSLGTIVATPGALKALDESGESALDVLRRHVSGDWGELDEEDKRENELSLAQGFRLFIRRPGSEPMRSFGLEVKTTGRGAEVTRQSRHVNGGR